MKPFLADWRNAALAGAGVVIVLLLWATLALLASSPGGKVVRVADRVITDQDIIKTMKNRFGDQLLSKMISDIIVENYAQNHNIEATDSDVSQVLDYQAFQAQLSNATLDDVLAGQGITLEEFKRDIHTQVLLTKLVVPTKDIENELQRELKSRQSPFTMPARYRYRVMTFATRADADRAYDILQKPDAASDDVVKEAAAFSTNPAEAAKVIDVIPAMMQPQAAKQLQKVVQGLKDGQCSKPMEMAVGASILQLVESIPERQPSMENSNILIGQYLMKAEKDKYSKASLDLEAKALDSTDVQFYTTEYQQTKDRFVQHKKENPNIPQANVDDSAASQPPIDSPAPAKTGAPAKTHAKPGGK